MLNHGGLHYTTINTPDVEAAENGKQESRDDGHGDGQQHCDYPIDPYPGHLKQSIAPDPHSVPAAHWHRLSYHIFKSHLEETENIVVMSGDVYHGEPQGHIDCIFTVLHNLV